MVDAVLWKSAKGTENVTVSQKFYKFQKCFNKRKEKLTQKEIKT